MSASRIDGTFSKIKLADDLPRSCGIYRFIGTNGQTLYVGKATDLRARVRSYFYGDPRRKIRDLLRQVERVDVETFATMLEAEVAEARAIARESPPHNRAGKRSSTWYLKIHVGAKSPKLTRARVPREDGHMYLGPFSSVRVVKTLIEALQDAFPIHRCTEPARCGGCAFSELGRCGGPRRDEHAAEIRALAAALDSDPDAVFDPLEAKMRRLAALERFEEAAEARERAQAVERALSTAAQVKSLLAAGDIVLRVGTRAVLLRDAQLASATDLYEGESVQALVARLKGKAKTEPAGTFVSCEVQREARVIWSWLRRKADDCAVIAVSGTWAMPLSAGRLGGRFSVKKPA
jgi:DNA polymerase-3 subunit epsilon